MLNLNKLEFNQNSQINFFIYNLFYLLFLLKINLYICFFNKKICILIEFFSYEFFLVNEFQNLIVSTDSVILLSLFTYNYFYFLLIGIILLFSMIGSIALCIR